MQRIYVDFMFFFKMGWWLMVKMMFLTLLTVGMG